MDLPLRLFARPEPGGESFDGLAALEVSLYDLRHVFFPDPEVPASSRIDDHVRAVLAESQTVHGICPDFPVQPHLAQLAL
jgi:hypothetical protein